jgi:cathepsin X
VLFFLFQRCILVGYCNWWQIACQPSGTLNFNEKTTGGSCNGGDHVSLKAYDFMHKYGISDETCGAKIGLDHIHSSSVASMTEVEDVRDHQCFECDWTVPCGFIDREEYNVNLYGVDEFGDLTGVSEMKAEIFARGPIACLNNYKGGMITCENGGPLCNVQKYADHMIVIAGWGVDEETGTEYWVGRNSYGTKWGEGAGGGWFRLELGKNYLNVETNVCSWAVPAKENVDRAIKQYNAALGLKE